MRPGSFVEFLKIVQSAENIETFPDTPISEPKEIFEHKFTLPKHMRHLILSTMGHKTIVPKEFPVAKVKTIYFDDIEDTAFNDSLDGFVYKRKYRLREYVDTVGGARYSLEVKLRNDTKTSKIRKLIYKPLPKDYHLTTFRDLLDTFERENGFSLSRMRMGLTASELFMDTIIYYERYRFDDPYEDARYNLDTNIIVHRVNKHERRLKEGIYLDHDIFEIKSSVGPFGLPHYLRDFGIEPAAFSKFVWGKDIFA